ncbi:MAG: hypothetical protein ABI963_15145 [Rhizomicrobium sp.]
MAPDHDGGRRLTRRRRQQDHLAFHGNDRRDRRFDQAAPGAGSQDKSIGRV